MSDSNFNDERNKPNLRPTRTGITRGGGFTIGHRPSVRTPRPQPAAPTPPTLPQAPVASEAPAVPPVAPLSVKQEAKPVDAAPAPVVEPAPAPAEAAPAPVEAAHAPVQSAPEKQPVPPPFSLAKGNADLKAGPFSSVFAKGNEELKAGPFASAREESLPKTAPLPPLPPLATPASRLSPAPSSTDESKQEKEPEAYAPKPMRPPEIKPLPPLAKELEQKSKPSSSAAGSDLTKFKIPQLQQERMGGSSESRAASAAAATVPPDAEKSGRGKLPVIAAAALAVVVVGAGLWYLRSGGGTEDVQASAPNTVTAAKDAQPSTNGAAPGPKADDGGQAAGAGDGSSNGNGGDTQQQATPPASLAASRGEPIKNVFYEDAQGAGAQTCSWVFPLLGQRVTAGASYARQSGWDKTDPDKRPIQSIAGLNYDQPDLKGHGAAVVFAVPNGGHCEGAAVRVMTLSKSCAQVDLSRAPTGSTKQDLAGVTAFNVARDDSQVILIPASDDMCIAVSVLRAGD